MEGRASHHLRLQNGAFERVYRTPTLAKHMRYEVVCEELSASSASGGQTSFLTHLDRVTIEYMSGGDGGQRGSAVEKGEGNKAKGKGIVFFNNMKNVIGDGWVGGSSEEGDDERGGLSWPWWW